MAPKTHALLPPHSVRNQEGPGDWRTEREGGRGEKNHPRCPIMAGPFVTISLSLLLALLLQAKAVFVVLEKKLVLLPPPPPLSLPPIVSIFGVFLGLNGLNALNEHPRALACCISASIEEQRKSLRKQASNWCTTDSFPASACLAVTVVEIVYSFVLPSNFRFHTCHRCNRCNCVSCSLSHRGLSSKFDDIRHL